MMKYFVMACMIAGVFLVATCKRSDAQDTPKLPNMIAGTISFMYEDGTIESINAEDLFATQLECYQAGREAVQTFLPQIPLVIGHLITCQPVGEDI